ncbi:hypothetical protein [Hansschlegelia sp. KR7-227]|jgi:hypothetical protein|uniref:hypothetical protein n=1 Tax=Hansschlegelia sp. KR7-227 TaxID=3400914 RepID=UPI003C0E9B4A
MRKTLLLGALAAAALACAPHAAGAQGMDERCSKIVDALCVDVTVGQCFRKNDIWDYIPQKCTGDVQSMVEMDREARQQQRDDRRRDKVSERRSEGPSFSCGGVLRSRPSMNASKVASVAEGQQFDSVEDAGVWFNEYKWYRVRYGDVEGYQWGGIFWTQGGREGTIPSCNG